jgi:hypothetical protein
METYLPTTAEPETALLDVMEKFLREGHPVLHNPPPPPWPAGTACPAGHFSIPAGVWLYRNDVPKEAATPYLLLGINGDCVRHVPDHDTYWNIEVVLHLVENRDRFLTDDPPRVMRELQSDFLADARMETDPPQDFPAPARLSGEGINVFYFYDVRMQQSKLFNGHPAHSLVFKVRCGGKQPTPAP